MPGFIDYYNYTFDELLELLNKEVLLPKRQILKTIDPAKVFQEFEKRGVKDLAYLQKRLKTKNSVKHYATELNIPEEYLSVLRRQILGYVPKGKPLKSFPCVTTNTVVYISSLANLKITNSYHLLSKAPTPKKRAGVAQALNIPLNFLNELTSYADLMRCFAIKDTIAQLYIHLGIYSMEKLANSDAETIYIDITKTNVAFIKRPPTKKEVSNNVLEAQRHQERMHIEI